MNPPTLRTHRLVLRRWTPRDREVFAQINGDPEVMRYRLKPLTPRESSELLDELEAAFDRQGFGQWAVERVEDQRVIGFVGLEVEPNETLFSPPVHVGWHLARDVWGLGYATEGATAALDHVFDVVGLPEVASHTTWRNDRSQAVMRRLGMSHSAADDFDAPWYPEGHPYRRFVLYRMTAAAWRAQRLDPA